MTSVKKKPGDITVTVNYGEPNFKWQMFFNTYEIANLPNGKLVRFAYISAGYAAEIVPLFLSQEGLLQLKHSANNYIEKFGLPLPRMLPALPDTRQFSPLFSNHLRVSMSGGSGELAFYTVPIQTIALAAQGKLDSKAPVTCVQVALLHCEVGLHQQFLVELLMGIEDDK